MNVITERPIYSFATGEKPKKVKKERPAKSKTQPKRTPKTKEEKEQLKAERSEKRAERKARRKANVKRLFKFFDRSGKKRTFFPLTRLRKNKDGKLVKPQPDGSELIVEKSDYVTVMVKETPTSAPVAQEFEKKEIATALNVNESAVYPTLVESTLIAVPTSQAPSSAIETKTQPTESVIALPVDETKIVSTDEGDFLANDTQLFDDLNLAKEQEKKPATDESKEKKTNVWSIVAIASGVAILLGLGVYALTQNKD